MRIRLWIVAVVSVVLAQSSVARNVAGQATQPGRSAYDSYGVFGRGAVDCGRTTNDLRLDRAEWEPDIMNFIQGYLTGANFHALLTKRGNPHVGKSASPQALLAAVELHCGQHPLDNLGDALESVYLQLAEK